MMPVVKIISYLFKMETGENGVGIGRREGERERGETD
jgi:hypothetical protein